VLRGELAARGDADGLHHEVRRPEVRHGLVHVGVGHLEAVARHRPPLPVRRREHRPPGLELDRHRPQRPAARGGEHRPRAAEVLLPPEVRRARRAVEEREVDREDAPVVERRGERARARRARPLRVGDGEVVGEAGDSVERHGVGARDALPCEEEVGVGGAGGEGVDERGPREPREVARVVRGVLRADARRADVEMFGLGEEVAEEVVGALRQRRVRPVGEVFEGHRGVVGAHLDLELRGRGDEARRVAVVVGEAAQGRAAGRPRPVPHVPVARLAEGVGARRRGRRRVGEGDIQPGERGHRGRASPARRPAGAVVGGSHPHPTCAPREKGTRGASGSRPEMVHRVRARRPAVTGANVRAEGSDGS
jgi:hypothetical protein